jgi:hypothetical protein
VRDDDGSGPVGKSVRLAANVVLVLLLDVEAASVEGAVTEREDVFAEVGQSNGATAAKRAAEPMAVPIHEAITFSVMRSG